MRINKPVDLQAELLLSIRTTEDALTSPPESLSAVQMRELRLQQSELLQQVAEMRRVHEKLELSRNRYRNLYDFAPVAYLTLNLRKQVVDVNQLGAQMLGMERSLLLGHTFARLVAAGDRRRYQRVLRKEIVHGGGQSCDLELQRYDASEIYVQLNCLRMMGENAESIVRLTLIDITARNHAENEIKQLAFHDALTGLANRRLLLERLEKARDACERRGRRAALLFLDFDDFKTLNDTHGHAMGDLLLQEVAKRLSSSVRRTATVSRLGGDEFAVVLPGLHNSPAQAVIEAYKEGQKVLEALSRRYTLAGMSYQGTASVGIRVFKDALLTGEDLLKQADLALYDAKSEGGNRIRLFDPEMQSKVEARRTIEAELRLAMQRKEFVLYYQPQVDQQRRLIGAEALLRWHHPHRGVLPPAEFLALADEKGMIVEIGLWVVEEACVRLKEWGQSPQTADLTMAVNVSATEFRHPDFVSRLLAIIDHVDINPRKLLLEFTESLMFSTMEETLNKMTALRVRGIRFALDDFGIGYSSLAYLQGLPLDQLKIDRTFVQHLPTNPNDAAIVKSVIALGQSLGLEIVAEGVETAEQWEFLSAHGCAEYQGLLFGGAGPMENLLLQSNCEGSAN
jgi:diguanylate cyclase (GGDEF)-like protein/PAS domain S-box-containing protein